MERGGVMSIFYEKETRNFCVSVVLIILFLFVLETILCIYQKDIIQKIFVSHDQSITAALLENGVSEKIIAESLTNTTKSPQSYELLNKLGITEKTDSRFLPFISDFQVKSKTFIFLITSVFFLLLAILIIIFIYTRDQIYKRAIQTVTCYTKGDFSSKLPQLKNGTIYHLFNSINDMAAALKSKQEAEHKTKEFLKNMISDISHQLKTPLAALKMYNEIVLDEPYNTETVKIFTEKSSSSIIRIEQLISSLLKIARFDSGSIEFNKSEYTLNEIVYQSINELTTRAKHENKEISINGSVKDKIFCDRQWTAEALSNIVKNALDHTDAGGHIKIEWKNSPIFTQIFISDDGSGISTEDIHYIFKRFYRGIVPTQNNNTSGIGLGLPLANSIIEGQGGNITVKSELNAGTTFTLTFFK